MQCMCICDDMQCCYCFVCDTMKCNVDDVINLCMRRCSEGLRC